MAISGSASASSKRAWSVVCQDDISRAEIVFQVRHRARSDNGAGDAGFAQDPSQGDLAGTAAFLVSQLGDAIQDVEAAIGEVLITALLDGGATPGIGGKAAVTRESARRVYTCQLESRAPSGDQGMMAKP